MISGSKEKQCKTPLFNKDFMVLLGREDLSRVKSSILIQILNEMTMQQKCYFIIHGERQIKITRL
jgi:hypothetical protein